MHLPTIPEMADFVVVTVFFKYIIGKWFADRVLNIFEYFVVKTERQAVYWVHFREKARGHGHQYPSPEVCLDGVCKTFRHELANKTL